jgi:hypothetical protein
MTTAKPEPSTAEQFLASQGIKFRVVPAKRGPGEWNVTFSRKGGGRLKLDYSGHLVRPTLRHVIEFLVIERPAHEDYQGYANGEADYRADLVEAAQVKDFFTPSEVQEILHFQCEWA